MKTTKMTEAEATEWIYDQDEIGELDQDQLEAAFAALHGRPADDDDRQNGLWSLCCHMAPNCGTRPAHASVTLPPNATPAQIVSAIEPMLNKVVEQVMKNKLAAVREGGAK